MCTKTHVFQPFFLSILTAVLVTAAGSPDLVVRECVQSGDSRRVKVEGGGWGGGGGAVWAGQQETPTYVI